MSARRVAIILPPEVLSIDDTQRAFGPLCENLGPLVSASDFVEIVIERNRISASAVETRVVSPWRVQS